MEETKKEIISEGILMDALFTERLDDLICWMTIKSKEGNEITSDDISDLQELFEKLVDACEIVKCYLKGVEMEAE